MITVYLATYLTMLVAAERALAGSHALVAGGHADEADVHYSCLDFAARCTEHAEVLAPIVERYADRSGPEPDRLLPDGLAAARVGPLGMLRDLQDLHQLGCLVELTWTLVGQAAAGARDRALLDAVARCSPEITTQLAWLRMRMRAAAPQTLLVAT